MEFQGMKEVKGRIQLSDEMLDLVSGGASLETSYFIQFCREKNLTCDEALNNAHALFADVTGASEELFGGDSLADVLEAVQQAYGTPKRTPIQMYPGINSKASL